MVAAFLFDADAFNFACAIGIIDELAAAVGSGQVRFHFVKNVEREIKGENRNRIEELRKVGAVETHRLRIDDETGRLFAKLMNNRRKFRGGPVHEGECANVAWASTAGAGEPIVVADNGGRALAEEYGLDTLGVSEFAFECVRLGVLSRERAEVCLERWQRSQGRPDGFEFALAYQAFVLLRTTSNVEVRDSVG